MSTAHSILQNPVETPFPAQMGIVPDCVLWLQAFAKDDSCSWIADRAGIRPADLYQYNPFLGTDGENCPVEFLPNYWYCVGTSPIEALTVLPSALSPDDANPTTPTPATAEPSDPNPSTIEPNQKIRQNILTAGTITHRATLLPPMTSTLPTRISTITMDDDSAPALGERDAVDADGASGELLRQVYKEDEGPEPESEIVTKIMRLVRRNRWMGRHQGDDGRED
ncbi:hypothetical protein F4810DRAFT_176855 [Camillea tinctor]|nr:hypothetical protein F4810DRAFT_176855 [Camillea tinctor]